VIDILAEKTGRHRFEHPFALPIDGDIRLYDCKGRVLLCTYRQVYPPALHTHMNQLLTNLYERDHPGLKEGNDSRDSGYLKGALHYGPHVYDRDTEKIDEKPSIFRLYAEAEKDLPGFYATLPHWHYVDKFIKKHEPGVAAEIADVNLHHVKVAGTCMNALAFTFHPVSGHRDKKDCSAGLITCLRGPPSAAPWTGGSFIIRMFGLKVPVRPGDHILFDSRIWHEVSKTSGVRFSVVAYADRIGSVEYGLNHIHFPEDLMDWLTDENFNLDKVL